MPGFLIDEDLPRSLATLLRSAGLEVTDIRDAGLRGASDAEVLSHARSRRFTLLTADLDFANLLRFPLGSHDGIIVARFPNETPVEALNQAIVRSIQSLRKEDIGGNLVIIEPGRVRVRSKP